jgi:hypothetical protein
MAGQIQSKIVTDSLVLHLDATNPKSYAFNGARVWKDLSGKENHATLTGPTSIPIYDSGGISFNGINTYATIDSTTSLTTTTPTIIVICTTNTGTIIAKGGYGSYWNYGLTGITPTGFRARNNAGDTFSPTFTTATTSVFNTYAMAWDGINVQFYRNGIYGGASSTAYSPTNLNLLYLRIGCAWNASLSTNVEFYSGKIGLIQIYNRCLSTNEILQNYNSFKNKFNIV